MSSVTDSVTTRSQAFEFMEEQTGSGLYRLAHETILTFLTFMRLPEISSFSLTCKGINALAKDNYLWELLFKERFPAIPLTKKEISYLEVFRKEHMIQLNLLRGAYAPLKDIESTSTIKFLDLAESNLIMSNSVYEIEVWNVETLECINNFPIRQKSSTANQGHAAGILKMTTSGNKLISASDKTNEEHGEIKLWDLTTGECLETIPHNEKQISCLTLGGDKLLLGGEDGSIRSIDLASKAEECLIPSASNPGISDLACIGNSLIIRDRDRVLKIMNLITKECFTLSTEITSFAQAEAKLITGDLNGQIIAWDLKTNTVLFNFINRDTDVISNLKFTQGKLVSRTMNGLIKIWDAETGTCLRKLIETPSRVLTKFTAFTGSKLFFNSLKDRGQFVTPRIEIYDFNASDSIIFAQIATKMVDPDKTKYSNAIELFMTMPQNARAAIDEEFFKISTGNKWRWTKGDYSHYSLLAQNPDLRKDMSQAISNYLSSGK